MPITISGLTIPLANIWHQAVRAGLLGAQKLENKLSIGLIRGVHCTCANLLDGGCSRQQDSMGRGPTVIVAAFIVAMSTLQIALLLMLLLMSWRRRK